MKQLIRHSIKQSLLAIGKLKAKPCAGFTYLIYHSVSGRLALELDIDTSLFQRQLAYIAQHTIVVDYATALARLQTGDPAQASAHVLTFDDGYENFYTQVFPLLRRWQLPAILFVTTGFVEERVAYPMFSNPGLAVEPVTWEMLGEMAESGLVTLGAHTHTHPVLTQVSLAQAEEELARPLELFQQRLGLTPHHFAYPRAIWNPAVESLVMRYYQSAVVGGGERATAATFHPYRIPRLPVRQSDSWSFFLGKLHGRMANEEAFYEQLRRFYKVLGCTKAINIHCFVKRQT